MDQGLRTFLEDNLESVICCPITYCVCFRPVLASDGFVYEESALEELRNKNNSKSPLTREPLSGHNPIKLISQLIEYADSYGLNASKDKYVNNESFEDMYDIISSNLKKGKYEILLRHNNFKLGLGHNNESFCQLLFCIESDDCCKYVKHVLDNSKDIDFVYNGNNILHTLFQYCKSMNVAKLVLDVVSNTHNINELLTSKNGNGKSAINYCMKNKNLIELVLSMPNVDVSFEYLVNCISNDYDIRTIKKMFDKIENVNQFCDGKNLLFCAIDVNKVELLEYFLDKGVNPENRSQQFSNYNAFHYACRYGRPEIALHMISISTEEIREIKSDNGWKMIHIACKYSIANVINELLELYVNVVDTISDHDYSMIDLVDRNDNLNKESKSQIIDYVFQLVDVQLQPQ